MTRAENMSSDADRRAATHPPLLAINDLSVRFRITRGYVRRRRMVVQAVERVSLSVAAGETVALVGESGSGKSTVARAVVGVVEPAGGQIMYAGKVLPPAQRDLAFRRRVQMVFQDPYASLDPRMSVADTIIEGLEIHRIGDRDARRERVDELLNRVGLDPSFGPRYPHQLSGGQRQRVGIARAISLNPQLVVADEPVSALDVSVRAQIINLLADLQEEFSLSYLVIAHDLGVVRHTSDRVAIMYLGRLMETGPTDEVFAAPRHPYTVALLSAEPLPNPPLERTRQRIILQGQIPSPISPPSGCRFSTRCWLRERLGNPEICTASEPELEPAGGGHAAACHFVDEMPEHV